MSEYLEPLLLFDSAFKRDSHARYTQLRAQAPVHLVRHPSGLQIHLVVSYEMSRAALAHPKLMKDPVHGAKALKAVGYDIYNSGPNGLGGNMLTADPPDHTRLRGLVSRAFTSRRVAELAPRVQEIIDQLIDAIDGHIQVDLVEKFTAPLPVTVISELMGVPPDVRDDFRRWTTGTFAGPMEERRSAIVAVNTYLMGLLQAKRREPGDDLLSALVQISDQNNALLSDDELLGTASLLITAGHETTVNLLGNAIIALLGHPEQAQLLRERPDLMPSAVEEFLRYDAPVGESLFRFAAEDVELGAVTIPRGGIVVVALRSAGRDPYATPQPDRLDVTRSNGRHLSFSHGIHYCLGAPLARLEASLALSTLLRRMPHMRSAVPLAEIPSIDSGIMYGPTALRVVSPPA